MDRTWKGTDQSASLEPGAISKLVRDLNSANISLNSKKGKILKSELSQRKKLKTNINLI